MVMNLIKKLQRTFLVAFKLSLFVVLFFIFFGLFGLVEPELIRFSRTAGIVMTTFAIAEICLVKIYGGFSIGIKKTKDIVSSLFLATFITDVIAYFELTIMRINFPNVNFLHDIFALIGIVILQIIMINLFSYLGNYLYFEINPPADVLVVYGEKDGIENFVAKINKYKKQYKITSLVSVKDDDLEKMIIDNEMIFLYSLSDMEKRKLQEFCYHHEKVTLITPDLSDIITKHSIHTLLDDVTVLKSRVTGLRFEQMFVKRFCDILVSGIGLLIASPVMLIEALAIKLEDGGPVFFKQPRVTKDGKEFNVLKFRTMIVDADKKRKRLASEGDDRITKVGNILRKLRIDELPQFINILKGEMSIVGPRPEQVEITEKYVEVLPEFKYRLKVKAGLTGLAQILGKYNTTPRDKLILDLMYIEQYSIWLDLKLMLQTAKVLFKSDSTEGVQGEFPIELLKDTEEFTEREELNE